MKENDPSSLTQSQLRAYRKKGVLFVISTLLIVIVSVIALQRSSIGDFSQVLSQANYPLLMLSWLIMSLAFVFMALRWRSLMGETNPPVVPLSGIVCAGLLLNYAAPGPVGELASAWFAHRRYNLTLSLSLASGVVARLIGLISAALIGSCIWLTYTLNIPDDLQTPVQMTALFVTLLGLSLLVFFVFPLSWEKMSSPLLKLLPEKISTRLNNAFNSLRQSIGDIIRLGWKGCGWATVWSLGAHAIMTLGIFIAIKAFGGNCDVVGLLFTYCITTAAAVLLFALPGSYVGWDALFFGLLVGAAQVGLETAAAVALTIRAQQLSYMLLGGVSLSWLMRASADNLD